MMLRSQGVDENGEEEQRRSKRDFWATRACWMAAERRAAAAGEGGAEKKESSLKDTAGMELCTGSGGRSSEKDGLAKAMSGSSQYEVLCHHSSAIFIQPCD